MSGGLQDALVALTDKFNAENGMGIIVNLTNQGGYSDLSTKLLGAIASETPAGYGAGVRQLDRRQPRRRGTAVTISSPWTLTITKTFLPGYRAEGAEFGPTYTIGFNKSVQVFFYNKTKYDELGLTAPTTWQELHDVAKAYTEATGQAGLRL